MQHIVIIGNGIAGATAARHIRKLSDHKISMISSESEHFFSRTALMYIYMGHMKYEHTKPYEDWFWEKNKIELVYDHVTSIDFRYKELTLKSGVTIKYDSLILALGSKPNNFGWPGQNLEGVGNLVSLQDLAYMEKYSADTRRAVIVGGGLIGIEMAEMFHSRGIEVTFLVREQSFWNLVLPKEESAMINRHIIENHIDLKLGAELKEIKGENGRVKGVLTSEKEEIPCQFVGITVGVSPNVDFLKGSSLKVNRGIMVNACCETNIKGVYAIGDCAEFLEPPAPGRRNIEQVWYTGRMMGEVVAQTICGKETKYQPGNWFNSAKFFEIEYQVYGQINPQKSDHEVHLYWEHKSGKKSIRLVAEKGSNKLLGINLMGVRFRHAVADQMLNEAWELRKVVEHFNKGAFDAEFAPAYQADLVEKYNELFPNTPIQKKKRFSLFG